MKVKVSVVDIALEEGKVIDAWYISKGIDLELDTVPRRGESLFLTPDEKDDLIYFVRESPDWWGKEDFIEGLIDAVPTNIVSVTHDFDDETLERYTVVYLAWDIEHFN